MLCCFFFFIAAHAEAAGINEKATAATPAATSDIDVQPFGGDPTPSVLLPEHGRIV